MLLILSSIAYICLSAQLISQAYPITRYEAISPAKSLSESEIWGILGKVTVLRQADEQCHPTRAMISTITHPRNYSLSSWQLTHDVFLFRS